MVIILLKKESRSSDLKKYLFQDKSNREKLIIYPYFLGLYLIYNL